MSPGRNEAAATASPARDGGLGRGFWTFWTASTLSTVGDGLYLSAVPLITLAYTRDPLLISVVTLAGTLPWVLFGLLAGALVDRLDRLRIMWTTDLVRFLVVGGAAVLLLSHRASVAVLAVTAFLLATGETLHATASQAAVPALVSHDARMLRRANPRLYGAQLLARDFAGKPLGGFLFSIAPGLPVLADAVSFAASSALIARTGRRRLPTPTPTPTPPEPTSNRAPLLQSVGEGLSWLWRHRLLRVLAVLVAVSNLVTAAWTVLLALLVEDRLGVSGIGFGVLAACTGVGGALGSLVATRLRDRGGTAPTMLSVMLLEGAATAGAGISTNAVVTGLMLLLVGASALVWNIQTVTLRQAVVPDQLYGRVVSAFRLLAMSTAPIGAVLGGVAGSTVPLPAAFAAGGAVIVAAALCSVGVVNTRAVESAVARTTANATRSR